MHPADLLTVELEQALEICRLAGWNVEVEYTAPPKQGPAVGQLRVIRCVWLAEGKLLLTAAGEAPEAV